MKRRIKQDLRNILAFPIQLHNSYYYGYTVFEGKNTKFRAAIPLKTEEPNLQIPEQV
jgi:hypothetical protein